MNSFPMDFPVVDGHPEIAPDPHLGVQVYIYTTLTQFVQKG